jgi:hypothetical protein
MIIVTVRKKLFSIYVYYIKYYSKQGEKIVLVRWYWLVRILIMSKSGFEDDEVLIKLIVGVVEHVTIDELGPVDYRDINRFL